MINELNQIKAALENSEVINRGGKFVAVKYSDIKQALTLIDKLIAEAGKHETN